jgi:uncharacterized RDD family membrane protein YckC
MLKKRLMAFIIDYFLIGIIVYISLEPFYSAQQRFLNESFFISNISEITFIMYLILSIILFKRTIGMKIFKLKIETESCIIKVSILRIILIPLNIVFYPITKKYLQDEITNSEIILEK